MGIQVHHDVNNRENIELEILNLYISRDSATISNYDIVVRLDELRRLPIDQLITEWKLIYKTTIL
jgi:hypothetical protein